jgi:AcrR family transcriptional regulator
MKKIDPAEITAYRARLTKALATGEKEDKDLSAAQEDREKFSARITELSSVIDYRDPTIDELPTLRLKHELCEKMVARLEEKNSIEPLVDLVAEGGILINDILREIAANRLETVTACILPFSTSPETAQKIARLTDACFGAQLALWRFRGMGADLRRTYTNPADSRCRAISTAREILAILDQATSKKGDLMQYLPYQPDPNGPKGEFATFIMLRAQQIEVL